MATKSEITALINANLASGSGITASEHREVLHTNPNSFLENVYSEIIEDTHTSQVITTSNANFNYRIVISKVGRLVHITGTFVCLNNVSALATIFAFSNSEYNTSNDYKPNGVAQNILNSEAIRILMFPDRLTTSKSIIAGESFGFSITYPVKD